MLGSDNVDKIGTILCVPWVDTYTMVGVEEKKGGGRFFFRSLPPRAKSGRFSPAVTAMVVVLPGDVIHEAAPSLQQTKLGPGVLPTPHAPEAPATLSSIHTGALGHIRTQQRTAQAAVPMHGWYVESARRRYVPCEGDRVIGQVTNRGAESFTVTLFSAHHASLPVLAFEGASRRNRPHLEIGALVYARIESAEPWTEPVLSCIDPVHNKADGMGELKVAQEPELSMVWRVSEPLARSLLRPSHTLLPSVSRHFAFEAAIGVNGLVWTRASRAEHVAALGRILAAADEACRQHALAGDASPTSLHKRIGERGELPPDTISQLV